MDRKTYLSSLQPLYGGRTFSSCHSSLSTEKEGFQTQVKNYCSRSMLLLLVVMQMPSMPSVFEAHGMDLRWQGWVASAYGVVSFLLAPVRTASRDALTRAVGPLAFPYVHVADAFEAAGGCQARHRARRTPRPRGTFRCSHQEPAGHSEGSDAS